ncbi:MAG: NADH-quinone oxidoreductase subunit J, partial [Rhodospirillales bacterium]|nr:NADH-quinone oxidoreductase subunit J [Rhodospirillales bacterium]
MTAPDLFFWLCAAVLMMSSVFVVSARSLVHAVFFLILAFLNAAGLFILLGAEFLGMMMLIVYVGAVAVLFLFVVMTLDTGQPGGRSGPGCPLPWRPVPS